MPDDVDSILVQHGRAHDFWRGVRKAKLPPLHAGLLAQVREAPAGTVNYGDAFVDGAFVLQQPQKD